MQDMNGTRVSTHSANAAGNLAESKGISAVVVGARGYSGLELCRILLKHPHARLSACYATEGGWSLADYLSNNAALAVPVRAIGELKNHVEAGQVIFLATPAEVSMELAPELLARGAHVIDLSGAYRLPKSAYEETYGGKHTSSGLLEKAGYGLVPWCAPLSNASGPALVSNPGCYATSVLLALIPVLRAGLIRPETIVIDAKSGTTGAGKKAAEHLLFTEVEGECLPYRIGKHQHLPEILQYLQKFAGVATDPIFTTHLLATRRGILASIYARLSSGGSQDSGEALAAVGAAFAEAYRDYPLVKFGKASPRLLSLKSVVGSARCQISFEIQGDKLFLFSTIDNLLKGASSQAVENMNRLFDLPVSAGLAGLEELT